METIWFIIVAGMLATYVILDGFDFGAGISHFIVGRNPPERGVILSAIGPVWDGNEVWLLAAGGTLYFAFPKLYAASFSGFYLPLMIVLWLLILRAGGIELRHQLEHPLWESFWDFVFAASSILLAIFFGAALGNVIRGVPLNAEGYFFEPLWTTFRTSNPDTGILDWYTVLTGLVALVALTVHGAGFLALKTEGEMNRRALSLAGRAWYALVLLTLASLPATLWVRPQIWQNYLNRPVGWLIPVAVAATLAGVKWFNAQKREKEAFLASCGYLASMLAGVAFGLYPLVLPASTDPAHSLDIYNSAAGGYGLRVGLIWWSIGIVIAIGYFVFLFRAFSGKVSLASEGEH